MRDGGDTDPIDDPDSDDLMMQTLRAMNGPRASFDVTSLPVEKIDPNVCHTSTIHEAAYTRGGHSVAMRERWALDPEFLASIRYWRGNVRPAYVRRPHRHGRAHVLVAGHRRWAACIVEKMQLAVVVIPDGVPEDEIARLAVEDNSAARHRDEIVRTREALASLPRVREELAERRKLGRGGHLDGDTEATTVARELAKMFFADLDRSHDHVRKLITLVQTSDGEGRWIREVPQFVRGGYDGDDLSPEQRSLRKLAQTLVEQLHPTPEGRKSALSVKAAYEQLETRYYDLVGKPIPGDRRDEVARRKAWARRADRLEHDAGGLFHLVECIKPYALMTERDKADLIEGLRYREWGYWARRWPWVMRLFLDVTYLMTEARVHSRRRTMAIELARSSPAATSGQITQLAAMFHQMGELFMASPHPDWWRDLDVIWPPMEPDDPEWLDSNLNLGPPTPGNPE